MPKKPAARKAAAPSPSPSPSVPVVPNPLWDALVEFDRKSGQDATAWYRDREATYVRPPRYIAEKTGGLLQYQADLDLDAFHHRLCRALGSLSSAFVKDVVDQLSAAPKATTDREIAARINTGLAFIASQNPASELETTILLQYWLAHRAFTRHVVFAETADNVNHLSMHGALIGKIGNLGVRQLEALVKVRAAGKQQIEVTHVHVHAGAQAVVGTVHSGGGGEPQFGAQSHGAVASLAFAPGSPVWSENPEREAVPVARDEGQGEMSRSRRQGGGSEG